MTSQADGSIVAAGAGSAVEDTALVAVVEVNVEDIAVVRADAAINPSLMNTDRDVGFG